MLAQSVGEVERTLTVDGQTATVATWRRAHERAKTEGVKVWHLPATRYGRTEEWIASSVSTPGKRHQIVNGACDCEGAQRGFICKHLAAVNAAKYQQGYLVRCATCGRVGPVGKLAWEPRWTGGEGYVDAWYCGEGYGHRA